jgi:hypothetical protein
MYEYLSLSVIYRTTYRFWRVLKDKMSGFQKDDRIIATIYLLLVQVVISFCDIMSLLLADITSFLSPRKNCTIVLFLPGLCIIYFTVFLKCTNPVCMRIHTPSVVFFPTHFYVQQNFRYYLKSHTNKTMKKIRFNQLNAPVLMYT